MAAVKLQGDVVIIVSPRQQDHLKILVKISRSNVKNTSIIRGETYPLPSSAVGKFELSTSAIGSTLFLFFFHFDFLQAEVKSAAASFATVVRAAG